MIRHRNYTIHGFTIVEMLVVVSVIGIIAAVSTFGFRGWQQSLATKAVKSDLTLAMASLENAKNFTSGYPTEMPGNFNMSDEITLALQWSDATRFCVQASSNKYPSVMHFIDSTQGKSIRTGICPASPITPTVPPAAPSPSSTPTSSSSITVTWPNVAYAASYTVSYGTSTPTTVASCSESPCAVTGLSSNTVYNISVIATNAYGNSPAGTSSATTPSAPPVCGSTSYRLVRSGLPAAQNNFYTLSYKRTADPTYTTFPGQYPTPGSGTYTFDQTITGLCTATGYSYTLFYRDQLGSILTTFTGTFTNP